MTSSERSALTKKASCLATEAKAEVKSFQRFEVGDGIEKKQDDFVGEVMAQVKASSASG